MAYKWSHYYNATVFFVKKFHLYAFLRALRDACELNYRRRARACGSREIMHFPQLNRLSRPNRAIQSKIPSSPIHAVLLFIGMYLFTDSNTKRQLAGLGPLYCRRPDKIFLYRKNFIRINSPF